MYKRDIYLDIDDNLNNYIKSVELDGNSRVWHFHLTVDYEPLDLTGKSVQFRAEKPDKTNVLNDCKIVDAEKGVVEVKLTRQVNAIPGHVKCLLKIIGDEGFVLKTKTFVVDVSKTLSDDAIVSSDEFGALEAALGKVQDIDNRFAQTNAQLSAEINAKADDSVVVKKGQVDLDDMTERTLQAIQGGEDTNFNLLSIPRDKSVTPSKTTFIEEAINRNLITGFLDNQRVVEATPTETYELDGWLSTELISIDKNNDYNFNIDGKLFTTQYLWLFDANKSVVGGRQGLVNKFNSGDCVYVRISCQKSLTSDWDKLILQKGATPSEIGSSKLTNDIVVPYLDKEITQIKNDINNVKLEPNSLETELYKDGSITPQKTSFFRKGNRFSINDVEYNKKIDTSGGVIQIVDSDDDNDYVSGFIDISDIPTGMMVIIQGSESLQYFRYNVSKEKTGQDRHNRPYFKQADDFYIRVTNNLNSGIETIVAPLGKKEISFSSEYDRYADCFESENLYNYKEIHKGFIYIGSWGYGFNDCGIYGYIPISNGETLYTYENITPLQVDYLLCDIDYNVISKVSGTQYACDNDNVKFVIMQKNSTTTDFSKIVISKSPISEYTPSLKLKKECYSTGDVLNNPCYGQICDSLGDSLTEANGFQTDIKEALNLAYFYNHGIGGTMMSGTYAQSMHQDVRIDALNQKAKLLTIMAGTNDYGAIFNSHVQTIGEMSLDNDDVMTFIGAYNTCIKKIYDKYNGDIQILIMTPLFNPQYNQDNFIQIVDACIGVAKMWNIPYLDLYRECGLNMYNADTWWTQEDRIHPIRETYTKKISPIIKNEILKMF